MFDVITIGSATRDVLMKVPDQLPLGVKVDISEIFFATGGGGTNAAVTFARQGFSTACVCVLGHDSDGDEILKELRQEGINTDLIVHHSDDRTAYSSVLIHPGGERTILTYKGEGQHFSTVNVPVDQLEAKWFYISSLGGHIELAQALIDRAKSIGAKVAWNPGSREIILKPSLNTVDVFSVNKEEARLLGAPAYAGIYMITDGANGVTVKDKNNKMYRGEVKDKRVVDRTGAGDAYCSGFVAEFMRSNDIEKAMEFGIKNATSVVQYYGAKTGILRT